MTTLPEYAAIAGYIYNDQRGGGQEDGPNKLDLPTGWQDLSRLGFTAGDNLNSNPFSFTAGAYINGSGEIVIGWARTYRRTRNRPTNQVPSSSRLSGVVTHARPCAASEVMSCQ